MSMLQRLLNRNGQSLTSTVIGVAVLSTVGAATASLVSSSRTAETELSASADASMIMDMYANNIRNMTRFCEIAEKFSEKTFSEDDKFDVKTRESEVCNSDNPNCDMKIVIVDVYDKKTGKKILSQEVRRIYTHYREDKNFTSSANFTLPEDTIGFDYNAEGKMGDAGSNASSTANYLAVNTQACPWDYQPNSDGTSCEACPAPSGKKQYRSGDCIIGTCPTGQEANDSKTGCKAIICPADKILKGDDCVSKETCVSPGSIASGHTKYTYNITVDFGTSLQWDTTKSIGFPAGTVQSFTQWRCGYWNDPCGAKIVFNKRVKQSETPNHANCRSVMALNSYNTQSDINSICTTCAGRGENCYSYIGSNTGLLRLAGGSYSGGIPQGYNFNGWHEAGTTVFLSLDADRICVQE